MGVLVVKVSALKQALDLLEKRNLKQIDSFEMRGPSWIAIEGKDNDGNDWHLDLPSCTNDLGRVKLIRTTATTWDNPNQ